MIRRTTVFLALFGALCASAQAAPVTRQELAEGWQVRLMPGDPAVEEHRRAADWIAARVPGTVQQDLIIAGIVPDPLIGTKEAAIQWVGLADWQYRRSLNVTPEMMARGHLDLVFEGLDTFAVVKINGRKLIAADNAHRIWRADAKPLLHSGANQLTIEFRSPIETLQPMVLALEHPLPGEYDSAFGDEPEGWQTSPYMRKPKYQYGWDWAPRIVTIGPWRAIRLEAWDDARIDLLRIDQEAIAPVEARIAASVRIIADTRRKVTVRATSTGPRGRTVGGERAVTLIPGENMVSIPLTIADPALWQVAGFGDQPLYTVQAELRDRQETVASATKRTGLRSVELIRDGGSFGLAVNGIAIFAKGANAVPFDTFPAAVSAERQRRLVHDAAAANMNMIRVWGGGYYPDDAFFDAADEAGVMIWQDFMFGGAVTPPDPAFRASVAAEAKDQVERLQAHPSLVIWGGNNEVQGGWENWSDRKAYKRAIGADEQERIGVGMAVLFDRVLRDAVLRADADVPYWPGSPSTDYEGPVDTDADGDRHFWDVWSGSKAIERYTESCPRFMSEFGFQAMPDLSTIARFAGTLDVTPDSAVMQAHQKFLSGQGNARMRDYLARYMREPRDLRDFVYLSQVLQAEAIQTGALHHRACRPVTLGSLYWQLNDSWPGISWASIDYYGRWKLLHHAARRFFAPQAIVAERIGGTRDPDTGKQTGADTTRLALVSDATMATDARWRVRAFTMAGTQIGQREGKLRLPAGSAIEVARLADEDLFGSAPPARSYAVADLLIDGKPVSRAVIERLRPREMVYPEAGVTARWDGNRVTFTAHRLARALHPQFGEIAVDLSDDGFDLLPGESRTITVASAADTPTLRAAMAIKLLNPDSE